VSARRLIPLLVAVAAILALGAGAAEAKLSPDDWLGRVNEVRAKSGLGQVAEDPSFTAGIVSHLNYLAQTPAELKTGAYASVHTENPASPYYTPEGATEAGRSDIVAGSDSARDAVDLWMTAPFHAIGILRPGLERAAFARDPSSGAAALDVIGGLNPYAPRSLVVFPGANSTTRLSRYNLGEHPSPLETCKAQHPGGWGKAGLPLIALLPEPPRAGLTAALSTPGGKIVDSASRNLCVVVAANYVSSDPVYGPAGKANLESDNVVLVIPRKPLRKGTYTALIAQPGVADVTWSFKSAPAADPSRVLDIKRRSQKRRTTRHGWVFTLVYTAKGAKRMSARVGKRRAGQSRSGRLRARLFFPFRASRRTIVVAAVNKGGGTTTRSWTYTASRGGRLELLAPGGEPERSPFTAAP
jgi:hypothetical protein